jgi:hypothetical protein
MQVEEVPLDTQTDDTESVAQVSVEEEDASFTVVESEDVKSQQVEQKPEEESQVVYPFQIARILEERIIDLCVSDEMDSKY